MAVYAGYFKDAENSEVDLLLRELLEGVFGNPPADLPRKRSTYR